MGGNDVCLCLCLLLHKPSGLCPNKSSVTEVLAFIAGETLQEHSAHCSTPSSAAMLDGLQGYRSFNCVKRGRLSCC